MIWRLVTNTSITLQEIETSWSYDDLERALAYLNFQQALEEHRSKI